MTSKNQIPESFLNLYEHMHPFLNYSIGENTVQTFLSSGVIFFVIFIALRIFRKFILKKLSELAKKTTTDIDDEIVSVIQNISPLFYWIIAFFFTLQRLNLSEFFLMISEGIFVIIVVYEIIKAIQNILHYILEKTLKEKDSTAIAGINLIIKISLWSIGLLLMLSNLGINVSALIASLGIGGIAVALAAQNLLSDLFSSFSIYFDKPFQIGDYVVIGTDSGIVQKIGLKTTRIQTLQGEELIISNKELTNARVQNFKKLKRRRVRFVFGVTYDTTSAHLKQIPAIVKKIVDDHEMSETERVVFTDFGASSLNYEVIYYLNSKEYNDYALAQHDINIAIKERFDEENIEMAFPTQTLYIKKETD